MIIVTGGAGFIGSCLLARLNQDGHDEIVVVDELGTSLKWRNLRGKSFVDVIHKDDFLDRIESGTAPWRPSTVFHLGACSSTTEQDADYLLYNNYHYSVAVAEWAASAGARLIYASSAATYGDGEQGFSDRESGLDELVALNMYAYSKHLFDLWARRNGLLETAVGLKFFNVFGPNEYHKEEMRSVVFKAWEQVGSSGTVQLFRSYREDYADGEQKRDFIYVKDCSEVMVWLMNHHAVSGIYNLGSGKARSWNDLVKAVFAALELPPQIEYIDMPATLRNSYQYFTEAEMTKLTSAGCPVALRSLEEGVADYVRNYLERPNAYL